MKVVIFDYGTGNLHSLAKAFEQAGAEITIEAEAGLALQSNALVLPGVGAFGAASSRLAAHAPSLRAALASGHPCLGINLGMQLLFETSEEGEGLGIAALRGRVRKLNARRLPHVGWNDVEITSPTSLFDGVPEFLGYYTNAFIVEPTDDTNVVGWTQHEDERFPAVVHRDRTWGVQFQPEKSHTPGLQLIRNFLSAAAR